MLTIVALTGNGVIEEWEEGLHLFSSVRTDKLSQVLHIYFAAIKSNVSMYTSNSTLRFLKECIQCVQCYALCSRNLTAVCQIFKIPTLKIYGKL